MALIPTIKVKGKHYEIYREAKGHIPTKAAVGKVALKKALEIAQHAEYIEFIPAKFTLQIHGWFNQGTFKNLSDVKKVISSSLKKGEDPVKNLEKIAGKWHYDCRIVKIGAPSWFGLTFFRAPWTGTPENKVQGLVKGYYALAPGGEKLLRFLKERAEKVLATEGVSERRDRLEWIEIKERWFKPEESGSPTHQPGVMIAIEYQKPAVVHRRQLDFIDVTFLGQYLKGRYYHRLVERKLNEDELTEWQKQRIKEGKAKAFYGLYFYFWQAKNQFDLNEMLKVAQGKIFKEKISAPPSKEKQS